MTAATGVVCLVAAVLIATVGQMQWPRLAAALVLSGVAGILNGSIGPYLQRWATLADHKVGQVIGDWTGEVVIGLVGLVSLAVAAFWIFQKKIDNRTLLVTATVPPTVTLIPGALGVWAVKAVGVIPWLFAGLASWAYGLGA